MGKLTVFFIILFLVVVGMLAFFNKGAVDLTVWKNITYPVPVIALILISTVSGILAMAIIVAIRDARRYIDGWQVQREQKKEKKINDSYSKGLDAFHASRYEEASELFARVIEDEPTHFEALMRVGDVSHNTGEYAMAKESYLKAREIRPKNIEVMLSLEKVSSSQQKWKEALKYLDEILEIDSENIQILSQKRAIYEHTGNWDELLEVQQKLLKCKLSENQEQEENNRLLGYKYESGRQSLDNGDTEKAIKTLRSIIKTDSHFTAAYATLAESFSKDGNIKEAETILLDGYEAGSPLVFLAKLEELYISEGEPGTIIDIYQKAIQKDQKNLSLQFLLAKLYYRLEMIDYAFDTVNAIDTTAFDNQAFHTLLGCIYERRSQHEESVEELKKALSAEDHLLVPFCCSHCDYSSTDWSGRCPKCKSWNTFTLDINEACKTQKRQIST